MNYYWIVTVIEIDAGRGRLGEGGRASRANGHRDE